MRSRGVSIRYPGNTLRVAISTLLPFLPTKGLSLVSNPFFLLCSSSFFSLQRGHVFRRWAPGLGWFMKDTALVAGLAVCVVLNENNVMAQNGGAFALMCWYERSSWEDIMGYFGERDGLQHINRTRTNTLPVMTMDHTSL